MGEATEDEVEATQQSPDANNAPEQAVLDAAAAVALAKDALERDGLNPKRYTVSASQEGKTWVVTFIGKQPRPPGDLVRVLIAADGTIEGVQWGK